ncbi:succinylglutamate desuccinylase/aspartoacylase [Rivularia sp. IAM M-261]|nr:succinylglutamate desuccinylase/aspartoacylase [Rivularia sp. IAM M-261]
MKSNSKLNRVLIVGGTHGNELTGAYLIKKFQQFPELICRSSFETLTLFANKRAFTEVRRYIDRDLNHCFSRVDLQDTTLSCYEDLRAKEIDQMFGPNSENPIYFIFDVHSTTTNMGLTLIVDNDDSFSLQLAAYLSSINSEIKVYSFGNLYPSPNLLPLRALAKSSVCVEVGAVAQGVLNADIFLKTEALVYAILDYLEKYNREKILSQENTLILYEYIEAVYFPRNEHGEIQAMIHPQLEFKDYQALHPDDPMLLTLDGKIIPYKGDSIVYPTFINEAAHYEKGIAMCLTQKHQITI